MKKTTSLLILFGIMFSLFNFQPVLAEKNIKTNSQEMYNIVGGTTQSIICGLAFVQYDAWMALALGLGGVTLGVGIAVSVGIGVAGVLIC